MPPPVNQNKTPAIISWMLLNNSRANDNNNYSSINSNNVSVNHGGNVTTPKGPT